MPSIPININYGTIYSSSNVTSSGGSGGNGYAPTVTTGAPTGSTGAQGFGTSTPMMVLSNISALPPTETMIYCVQNTKTGKLYGREPRYDTSFKMAYEDNVEPQDLMEKWNDLLKYDRTGIMNFLRARFDSEDWLRVGGDPSAVSFVEIMVSTESLVYQPGDLLGELIAEDAMIADEAAEQLRLEGC